MASSERLQINLQYTLPSTEAETLLAVAREIEESPITVARVLLAERLFLLREGWRYGDSLFFAITQALAVIPIERREEIVRFLGENFSEAIETALTLRIKREATEPTPLPPNTDTSSTG
jgi:hypothetical protein